MMQRIGLKKGRTGRLEPKTKPNFDSRVASLTPAHILERMGKSRCRRDDPLKNWRITYDKNNGKAPEQLIRENYPPEAFQRPARVDMDRFLRDHTKYIYGREHEMTAKQREFRRLVLADPMFEGQKDSIYTLNTKCQWEHSKSFKSNIKKYLCGSNGVQKKDPEKFWLCPICDALCTAT